MKSNIRQLRKNKHLSQKQLGEKIGLSQQVISRMERDRDKLQIDVLIQLADYFDVSTDYVLGYQKLAPVPNGWREAVNQQSAAKEAAQIDYQAFQDMEDDRKKLLYYHLMQIKELI